MVTNKNDAMSTLEGIDAVRVRPGMYIGSPRSEDGENPRALIHIAQEIISNATDEGISGYGDQITVTVHEDNSMSVLDYGRGIPMGDDFDKVIRGFTVLHSSGKLDSKTYRKSGGQNGIGAKATNAASKWLKVEAVTSMGDAYSITFRQKEVIEKSHRKAKKNEKTMTKVTFLPDDTFFDDINWDIKRLKKRIDDQAYLSSGIEYVLIDERIPEGKENKWVFKHNEGMKDLVSSFTDSSEIIGFSEPARFENTFGFKNSKKKRSSGGFITEFNPVGIIDETMSEEGLETIDVEFGIAYTEDMGENIVSFANGIPTTEGGPHVEGAKQAINDVFNDFARNVGVIKRGSKLDPSDTRDGLVLALSVAIPESMLQFESQTKEKLATVEARTATREIVTLNLTRWLHENEKKAKEILDKIQDAKKAREMATEAKRVSKEVRKSKNSDSKILSSSKLTSARSRNPKDRELFIVEGESAGGSAKKGRDSMTQAIFALTGKPLNVYGMRAIKVIKNEEISTIINAIGTGIGPDFDIDNLQYNKIIIMADADDDGFHIVSLLIQVFWAYMPDLIRNGHVYVAQAPLYRLSRYVNGKREKVFIMDNYEYDEKKDKYPTSTWTHDRLKGLGEMSEKDLRDTTMKKGKRRLIKLTADNEREINEAIHLFFNNKNSKNSTAASKRREWIIENIFEREGDILLEDLEG